MAKTVDEVLAKAKGTDKVSEVLTGKGAFSKAGFEDLVSAAINDTGKKLDIYEDGKSVGTLNISELIRDDLKKTLEKAKYPQKSEADVLDTTEISAKGLAKAIPYIVQLQIEQGKKFDIPQGKDYGGSIYLKDVAASDRTVPVRDPQTQKNLGTCEIINKESKAVVAKSPVPAHLQKKIRKP